MGNDILGTLVGAYVAIYVIDKMTGKRKKVYIKREKVVKKKKAKSKKKSS